MSTHDEIPVHTPPKSIVPILIGSFFMIALFAIAVRLLMAWTPDLPDEDAARGEERTKAREELAAHDAQRLQEWGWADKEAGAVQMPISTAMERTIESLNSSTPQPAGPIDAAAAPAAETTLAPDADATPVEDAPEAPTVSETPAAPEAEATPASSPAP